MYHYEAKRNAHEMMFDAMKYKGDLDAADITGKTAMMLAVGVGSVLCVQVGRSDAVVACGRVESFCAQDREDREEVRDGGD